MLIRDTSAGYGLVTRLTHWVMALASSPCSCSGCGWSRSTTTAPTTASRPDIHRSVGMLLLIPARAPLRLAPRQSEARRRASCRRSSDGGAHRALGFLSAAAGAHGERLPDLDRRRPADQVFDWFSVPALVQSEGLEDTAGFVHEILAYVTMASSPCTRRRPSSITSSTAAASCRACGRVRRR